MNFSCIFPLALALLVASTQAYVSPMYSGVDSVGYNGVCGNSYGGGYGVGYGTGYDTGFGCRSTCATACAPAAAVCDTCQCVKTVVRPNVVERIPYACSRRLQAPTCRSACGLYSGGAFANGGAGYLNGGYLY